MIVTDHIAAEHGSFNRIRQVAPISTFIRYTVPWAHASLCPNGISIGSAVFAGLTRVTSTHRPRYITTCIETAHI